MLLPCNVVVQKAGDGVLVSIANPRAMFSLVDNEALETLAAEAEQRLRRALDAIEREAL